MNTLGDVITVAIALAALIIVPYKIVKAWLSKPRVMSRNENTGFRTAYEPPEPIAVLADTHQPEPVEPSVIEPASEPIRLRQLPRHDLIVLLAVQRKEDGEYLFSANQITTFVGGTAANVKTLIAEVRAEKQEQRPPGRLERPANGWPAISKN